MEREDYWNNELVLYKTSGKVKLPHKETEDINCLVTEGHVVIETDEVIKIPLSHIKKCRATRDLLSNYSYSEHISTRELWAGTAELAYVDDQNVKHELSFQLDKGEQFSFHAKVQRAIKRPKVGQFIDEPEKLPKKSVLSELFRDKTRDDICAGLRELGIDVRMATRGRVEEGICGSGSLGIIHILEGPIRWVNVRKEELYTGPGEYRIDYYTEYGVPDRRLGPKLTVPIESVRKKHVPVLGPAYDVRWEGKDYGGGIISRLNSDEQLKEPIKNSRDVKIESMGDYGCWIMVTKTRDVPSLQLWDCYQKIAEHLLVGWPSR